MKRNYFVFVQTLFVTIVIFLVGFYIGMSIEGNRANEMNSYYTQSEVALIDILSLNKLVNLGNVSCSVLEQSNKDLLDRVYDDARLLTQYEESGKLTNNLKDLHKKYDVLRTYLWINSVDLKKKCPSKISTIVYLYNYEETDLTKKAEQNVWSKLLLEIKNENPEVVLIPIAYDSNLISLNSLVSSYNITSFPSVIVNEKTVFSEISSKEEIFP
ncbi:hypothetical protein J4412_00105 [Candidatus Pacearchaeota archaeon]|nr:MAG: hypothetical protein QJ16_C0005G0161 [archaeon GW2011_AR1]MBS3077899.1 hypothetical protein [Candidatus Pacearchaeota archaeon]HIH52299.1 hypothetical protein [Nanoarchaeota archaeon]